VAKKRKWAEDDQGGNQNADSVGVENVDVEFGLEKNSDQKIQIGKRKRAEWAKEFSQLEGGQKADKEGSKRDSSEKVDDLSKV